MRKKDSSESVLLSGFAIELPTGFLKRFNWIDDLPEDSALRKNIFNALRSENYILACQLLRYDLKEFCSIVEPKSKKVKDFSEPFQKRYDMLNDSMKEEVDKALSVNNRFYAFRILKLI